MLNHKGTKTIATPRLLLRPFIIEDAHDMYANWASDPRVTKYLTWMPHESPEATAELLSLWVPNYENPAYYNWVITLEGRAIGNVSIVRQSDKSEYMEFGYCLSASYWNQGI
ncbi:MAG: GNAT family N-acetyltransferase, partial [Clostridia bacterium]|nr:GNAT family N-acetyltransferase [Clostridia bacterium]